MRQVIVKDGQSIYDIALQELGSVEKVHLIYMYNSHVEGLIELDPGTELLIADPFFQHTPPAPEITQDTTTDPQAKAEPTAPPTPVELPAYKYDGRPLQTITTREGQDIYDIALQHFGNINTVPVIYAFNPDLTGIIDLDRGTTLQLPRSTSITPLAPNDTQDQGILNIPQEKEDPEPSPGGTNKHDELLNRELPEQHPGTAIELNTADFDGNLDENITDVQKLAERVDEMPTGGMPEAPDDDDVYVRGSLAWIAGIAKSTFASFVQWTEESISSLWQPVTDGSGTNFLADDGTYKEAGGGSGGHTLQTPDGTDLPAKPKFRAKGGLRLYNEAGEQVDFTSLVLDALIELGVADQGGTVRTIQAVGSETNIDVAIEPKGNGEVKSTKWAGTGERILTSDADGKIKSDTEMISPLVLVSLDDTQGRNLVNDEWTVTTFARDGIPGQFGKYDNWEYKCTADDLWVRTPVAKEIVLFIITDANVISSLTNAANWDSNNDYIETDTNILDDLSKGGVMYYDNDYIYISTPNSTSTSKAARIAR